VTPIEASARPTAQKARPIELRETDSTEDSAVCVFSGTLDHFEANLPIFRAQESIESVHQMRVALRRLRAAIGLFGRALSGPALENARLCAKELANTLGEARNWDVFHDLLTQGPGGPCADDPSFYALLDALELRRARAYWSARDAIESDHTQSFVKALRLASASRDWDARPEAREAGSARAYGRAALTRLRKRVLRKSKDLAKLTPERRHEARIALKQARYGAEFFSSLYSPAEAADFIAALARIQDGLGVYNDIEMVNALLDEIDSEGGPSLRASAFVRGWFAHAAAQGVAHARKSEKRLHKLRPYWT
jgi:triphosphatase